MLTKKGCQAYQNAGTKTTKQQDSLFENCLKVKSTRTHLISKNFLRTTQTLGNITLPGLEGTSRTPSPVGIRLCKTDKVSQHKNSNFFESNRNITHHSYLFKLGDYPHEFLEEVGYDPRERNPSDIPGDIRPGSESDEDYDDEDSSSDLDDIFDTLSVEDIAKKPTAKKRNSSNTKKKKSDPEDDMRRFEVIVQNQVLCPMRSLGIRKRLCCSALLDCGVKLNTIEPHIDRAKGKIYLTGEYQSTLKKTEFRMGDIDAVDDGLLFPYQEHLNRNVSSKWTMVADIPPDIEVENNFVDPRTNLPIEDPITIASVPADASVDGLCSSCLVAHFFIISVNVENPEPPQVRRERKIFSSPPPQFPTSNYTSNNGYKRGRTSSNGGHVSNNGNGGQNESDSLNEVLDGE